MFDVIKISTLLSQLRKKKRTDVFIYIRLNVNSREIKGEINCRFKLRGQQKFNKNENYRLSISYVWHNFCIFGL